MLVVIPRCRGVCLLDQAVGGVIVSMGVSMPVTMIWDKINNVMEIKVIRVQPSLASATSTVLRSGVTTLRSALTLPRPSSAVTSTVLDSSENLII